ncbi:MAG: Rid family hydrolase [Pseudodonghicola sp.]
MSDIDRLPHRFAGRVPGIAHGGLAYVAAVDYKLAPTMTEQAKNVFARLDSLLTDLGSDRTRIINATIHLSDMGLKAEFDAAWADWIGADPSGWPLRTCVGGALASTCMVEIMLVAAQG